MRQVVVAVVGYSGGVGKCLVSAMKKTGMEPFALVRSSTMKIDGGNEEPVDFKILIQRLLEVSKKKDQVPIIADVTASRKIQDNYAHWLKQGISVVTANKGIFAGPEAEYRELLTSSKAGKSRILHEATVGAGLPIISTIQGLVASSHEIKFVEGILSGTLAFVLGQIAGGKKSLSEAVKQAKELGYTEPDPRDDLNGLDVARKAVILGRLCGLEVELSGMNIESLVPEALRDCSVEEFMSKLSDYDEDMRKRVEEIESSGKMLHYSAKVDVTQNKVEVGLQSCEASHPFNTAGTDNMVAITTNFYTKPLVVKGAGAGGDVTATGVLVDILQCAYE